MKALNKILVLAAVSIFSLSIFAQSSDTSEKKLFYEVGYTAGTFDNIKESGSYGFSFTLLPWKLGNNLSVGVHFSPFNLNYGLVDSDFVSDIIMAGPAISYSCTPNVSVEMPLDLTCTYIPDPGQGGKKYNWGLALSPVVHIGKKIGGYVGPFFSVPFSSDGDSKISTGFRAGIYF